MKQNLTPFLPYGRNWAFILVCHIVLSDRLSNIEFMHHRNSMFHFINMFVSLSTIGSYIVTVYERETKDNSAREIVFVHVHLEFYIKINRKSYFKNKLCFL
jgi:hypothetical protein